MSMQSIMIGDVTATATTELGLGWGSGRFDRFARAFVKVKAGLTIPANRFIATVSPGEESSDGTYLIPIVSVAGAVNESVIGVSVGAIVPSSYGWMCVGGGVIDTEHDGGLMTDGALIYSVANGFSSITDPGTNEAIAIAVEDKRTTHCRVIFNV